jgi:hypothetical protein
MSRTRAADPPACWLEMYVTRTYAQVTFDGPGYIAILPR